ncbi:DNA-binding domain-containing protein [Spirillospora sp. NBC_01491]|uniref:DNA-binding domain-containing protein n=1 Tax=Spirillospora sp. NBC_01491 TaxID=2976007 RepID=UPI002E34989E|nr:DNA-binding domain-containing protein [Spirillospora sp. NBC_01491]
MPELDGLAGLQRWMQHAILDPKGVTASAGEVLTASSGMTARERLAIYWRGYRLRLLECMRELHPGLIHLLGEELFDAFALEYLDSCPPRDFTLSRLDAGFAGHLAETRPDTGLPPAERQPWVDVMIDLARFERAVTEVLDGPGTEDGPVLDAADLALHAADLASTAGAAGPGGTMSPHGGGGGPAGWRLATAPCLRLLRLSFPAHQYATAVRHGQDPPFPALGTTYLAVGRRDYAITIHELGPRPFRALRDLSRGATVGTALRGAARERGPAWLRHWAGLGFFTAIERPAAPARPSRARAHGPRPTMNSVERAAR